ncbi:MAG: SpoIVB peptidase [Faecalibacterium sp.]
MKKRKNVLFYKHSKMGRAKLAAKCLAMTGIYALFAALAWLGWLYQSLPDTIYVEQGEAISIARLPYVSVLRDSGGVAMAGSTTQVGSYNVTLSVGGVIPIKTVRTIVTDRPVVTVCGTPFGIKILSQGALVVGFTELSTAEGAVCPAKDAGLAMGDLIISMNGQDTSTNEDVAAAVEGSNGEAVTVVYTRDEIQYTTQLTPVQSATGKWMAGLWVRDSSAGVGTMTFVDESTGVFAGLGHSISDSDTGESFTLRSGEIMDCEITDYQPGSAGSPGSLEGQFVGAYAIGSVSINGDTGIYGTTRTDFEGQEMEIAFAQEVELGAAEIWTTIDGQTAAAYAVEITSISYSDDTRNLVIQVTDEALLAQTGGILQGMSGSPIIQNGRLVGAVTHVFVNDPTCGYGIFVETMLETAEEVEELAEAS